MRKIYIFLENEPLMKKLLAHIKKLKQSCLAERVNEKIREFESVPRAGAGSLFSELCYCILTAGFNAERAIKIQQSIGDGFYSLPKPELRKQLRHLGHRFPNVRADYIVDARRHYDILPEIVRYEDNIAREWLACNVKGISYKEASHFLRNTGSKNLAIIDFHILDILDKYSLISKPRTKALSRKLYLETESLLRNIAKNSGMNLAELDLYLWYAETGKILK